MPEWKDFLATLSALVASFAGAWAAFALENRRRTFDRLQQSVAAGNRAIYTIYSLWNVLEQYRKEVLEPYRSRPDAWLNLAAHPVAPMATDKFQVTELQFLFDQNVPSVFATLLLEEQRYSLAINLIKARSDLILNEVFPKMAEAGFAVGQSQEQAQVEQALGIDLCHKLKEMTSAIYKNVDEDLASLKEAYSLLRNTMKSLYPKKKFLEIVFEQQNSAN
jgi:hypothetical protein